MASYSKKTLKPNRLMPPGVESFVVLVDYEGVTMFNATPVSVSRRFLQILGDHYPERLGFSALINPSWYLPVMFRLLGTFLDPVTRSKIHFVRHKRGEQNDANEEHHHQEGTGGYTNLEEYIDHDQLLERYGGSYPFEYSFEDYWPKFSVL
jgi:CRAL/TRIO domain